MRISSYTVDVVNFLTANGAQTPITVQYVLTEEVGGSIVGVCYFIPASRLPLADVSTYSLEMRHYFIATASDTHIVDSIVSCMDWLKNNDDKVVSVIMYHCKEHNDVYERAGFNCIGKTKINYHYEDAKGDRLHRRHIYKKAISLQMTEGAYANKEGLRRISDIPKYRFRCLLQDRSSVPVYGIVSVSCGAPRGEYQDKEKRYNRLHRTASERQRG